jgi:Chaperone of endosialidase
VKQFLLPFAILATLLCASQEGRAQTFPIDDNCTSSQECLLAVNSSTSGGSYGIGASSPAPDGSGVQGAASGANGSGVYGLGLGSNAVGVYAWRSYGNAIYANSDANAYGVAAGSFNVNGSDATAIVASNAGSGTGIYADCSGTCNAGYFVGNVYASGSVTWSSDSRLKKNIQPLAGALDDLLRLKGVTFEWNNADDHAGQTGTQRGFIAQDVEKVFPGWVGVDQKGFKTLSVQQIEALEVESIRALKAENDDLKERVKALEGRRPVASNAGGLELGLGGLGLAAVGMVVFGRRKRDENCP